LKILLTADADRLLDGAAVPHIYATQVEFLRKIGNNVRLFGVDDRTSPYGIWRNIRELREEVTRFHPDLLVSYYGTVVAAVTRLAAGHVPFVITFRGSDLLGTSNPGWKWRLRDRLGRLISLWTASGARWIIVNGSGLLQSLPSRYHHKASNLPNGIDTGIFFPVPKDQARAHLGWASEDEVILFNAGVGSGQVVKNRPLAEDVITQLQTRQAGVRLEAISTCTREEVALRMNASNCLLVTSLHEGSPDLVKEALACNLPVVSVPCGDVPERLQGVEPGGVCPYDAAALAKLVEAVVQAGLRSNGREQLFLQGLDISNVTLRVLDVYRMAIQ
jgi:teichuronic acid biosynthesis glycosyltransferase TuaC